MDVNATIQIGDVLTLRRLLRKEPSRANELIRWGIRDPCLTHPLHYISDMLFKGILPKGSEVALAEALIEAGADLNFQSKREDGKKGDTPLIGATSGIRLLDAGARPELRGLFGETARHWAAMLGEDRLAARLIESSDMDLLNLKDQEYQSAPVGWAVHGWCNPPAGNHGHQQKVVELLAGAGVTVERSLLESDDVRTSAAILAALR